VIKLSETALRVRRRNSLLIADRVSAGIVFQFTMSELNARENTSILGRSVRVWGKVDVEYRIQDVENPPQSKSSSI